MRRLLTAGRSRLQNLKLKWKILIITLLVLLCSVVTFLLLYKYTWAAYEKQIYAETASSLELASARIDAELLRFRAAVAGAETNSSVQAMIRQMEAAPTLYDSYSSQRRVLSMICDELNKYGYVLSVHYVSAEGRALSSGFDTSYYSAAQYAQFYQTAVQGLGRPVWLVEDETLIVVSNVLETADLSLRDLGMIMVRVQPSLLVSSVAGVDTRTDDLFLFSGGRCLYHNGGIGNWQQIEQMLPADGYTVAQLESQTRFLSGASSQYADVQYGYVVSYDSLFSELARIRRVALAIFVLVTVLLTLFSFRIARSIVRPMYQLVGQMSLPAKQALSRNNALAPELLNRHDETGVLANAYQEMLRTIETLIQENYVKQLTIKDTQYRTLQAQLNPHFIYNTLDSIYWMAQKSGQEEVALMILSLGKLMRESITRRDDFGHLITLREELRNLNNYLNIQRIRFRDALNIQIDIPPQMLELTVPRLLLQPLVENSIHYGLETINEPCWIVISGRQDEAFFELCVTDTGVGVEDDLLARIQADDFEPRGSGVGLKNILLRLNMLYGDKASLQISNCKPHGAMVVIRLPYRRPQGKETLDGVQRVDRG